MGVGVLRNVGGGLDYSELMKEHNVGDASKLKLSDVHAVMEAKTSVDNTTNTAMMSKTNSFYVSSPNDNVFNANAAADATASSQVVVADDPSTNLLSVDTHLLLQRNECKC